jgi:peptidoglycan/LPS O-acetylase OafA/YrhL
MESPSWPIEEKDSDLARGKASYDYIPALDGFRGVAILTLMLSHGGLGNIVPGVLALLTFFVISSFLITRQMIVEIEKTGTMNLKNFYLRRIFRLIPALVLFIIFFTPIMYYLGIPPTLMQVASVLFYFANYFQIFIGYPVGNPFPIVWSLSVEEHYYILLPCCMLFFSRNVRRILPWLCAVLIGVLLWRIQLYHSCVADPAWWVCGPAGSPRWKGTDVMLDCVLYGAVAALLLHYYNQPVRRWCINRTAFVLSLAGIGISLAIRSPAYRETFRFTVQTFCVSIMVLNILFGKWSGARDVLSSKFLIFVGQISYSLYLFHFGVLVTLMAFKHEDKLHGADFLLYALGSPLLATISYYLIERPMVAVRKRFGSHRKEMVG